MRVRAATRPGVSNGWHNMGEQDAPEHVGELLEHEGTTEVILTQRDKSQLKYTEVK